MSLRVGELRRRAAAAPVEVEKSLPADRAVPLDAAGGLELSHGREGRGVDPPVDRPGIGAGAAQKSLQPADRLSPRAGLEAGGDVEVVPPGEEGAAGPEAFQFRGGEGRAPRKG